MPTFFLQFHTSAGIKIVWGKSLYRYLEKYVNVSQLGKNWMDKVSHLCLPLVASKPAMAQSFSECSPWTSTQIIFHSVLTGFKEPTVAWSCSDCVDGKYDEAGEPHTDLLYGNTLTHWAVLLGERKGQSSHFSSLLNPHFPCPQFGFELSLLSLVMIQFSLPIVSFAKYNMKMVWSDHWQFKNSY